METVDEDRTATVLAILAAWSRADLEAVASLFAEDGVFHCMMRQPIVGRSAFHRHLQTLQSFKPGNKVDIQVRHLGQGNGLVFAERLDRVQINGREGEIPAVGVFEVRNGEVTHWREYFDQATLSRERGESPAWV
jgi:limonene-1,2-epoxide hydrolase